MRHYLFLFAALLCGLLPSTAFAAPSWWGPFTISSVETGAYGFSAYAGFSGLNCNGFSVATLDTTDQNFITRNLSILMSSLLAGKQVYLYMENVSTGRSYNGWCKIQGIKVGP